MKKLITTLTIFLSMSAFGSHFELQELTGTECAFSVYTFMAAQRVRIDGIDRTIQERIKDVQALGLTQRFIEAKRASDELYNASFNILSLLGFADQKPLGISTPYGRVLTKYDSITQPSCVGANLLVDIGQLKNALNSTMQAYQKYKMAHLMFGDRQSLRSNNVWFYIWIDNGFATFVQTRADIGFTHYLYKLITLLTQDQELMESQMMKSIYPER